MILKYYINKNKEKVYTLKEKQEGKETLDAHYKFIKFTEDPNKEKENS